MEETNTFLHIEIQNDKPLELIDLTKSLYSIATQFATYTQKQGASISQKQAKLYIKEIKSGSVILDLIELAPIALLPFAENANVIFDFAKHIKRVFDYFAKGEGEKPELSVTEYKEFSNLIRPISQDPKGKIIIAPIIDGHAKVEFNISINYIESNAAQNKFNEEIEAKEPPVVSDYQKVVFYWYQAKSDIEQIKGNKGKIESITKKAMNVIFDNDKIKEQMLMGENNPFTHAFIVDVGVQTINEKPVVYKIMKVHDVFLREED